MKKLYKSKDNKVVLGLLGGVGEYFDVDPLVIRIGFVVVALLSHLYPAIILYFIISLFIPSHPGVPQTEVSPMPMKTEEKKEEPKTEEVK